MIADSCLASAIVPANTVIVTRLALPAGTRYNTSGLERPPLWPVLTCPRMAGFEVSTEVEDAEEAFPGLTYTYEDDRLAYGERRFVTLGLLREIVVSIVHTEDDDHIHVISMRKATKRERKMYFESIAN